MDPRIIEVVESLEARLHEKISFEDLAAEVGLSRSRMARLFKAAIGQPPGAYVQTLRMTRAPAARAHLVERARSDGAGGHHRPQPLRARLPKRPWAEPACVPPAAAPHAPTDALPGARVIRPRRALLTCSGIGPLAFRLQRLAAGCLFTGQRTKEETRSDHDDRETSHMG